MPSKTISLPPLRVAHVGDVGSSRDMTIRIVSICWISHNTNLLPRGRKVQHDSIDLSGGRDFLAETEKYDVVLVQYIFGLSLPHVKDATLSRYLVRSPLESRGTWRKRLLDADPQVIITFGGSSEISGVYIGDLPGYTSKEYFDPPPVQFVAYRRM